MHRNIFIIHGSYGAPDENWFPWLKQKLEDLGHTVFVPCFPTPKNQTLSSWKKIFNDYIPNLNSNSIVIGHSLGPAFLINVLEEINTPIFASFFVCGFVGLFTGEFSNQKFNEINETFTNKIFEWTKIKNNCSRFFLYYSDDDPYVPQEKAIDLGNNLDIKPKLISNAGHFNTAAGYSSFDLLFSDIQKIL